MSELTRCNYCTLQHLKRVYGAKNLIVQPSMDFPSWTEVVVKGERLASFMQLTEKCAC